MGGGNPGRSESGNRIDSRARGNASQLYEKYKALAGDAQRQGDRVNTEYYLQFADHYFRVLAESRPRFEEQQARANGRDEFDDEFDGDGEDFGQEGEPARPDQYQPRADDRYRQDGRPNQDGRQAQDDRPRQQLRQDGRPDDRPRRDDRPRQDRQDARPEQLRPEHSRADQPRPDQQRQDQQRPDERPRQDRPRRDGTQNPRLRNDSDFRAESTPEQPVVEPSVPAQMPVTADERITPPSPELQEASTVRAADMEAPVPRRRGRPPKVRPEESVVPVQAEPSGFDVDRLPPSLSVSASAEPDSGEPVVKPRRRRRVVAEPADAGQAN